MSDPGAGFEVGDRVLTRLGVFKPYATKIGTVMSKVNRGSQPHYMVLLDGWQSEIIYSLDMLMPAPIVDSIASLEKMERPGGRASASS